MGGFLFHETVFGPVMSRRLGVSLGINLLPVDYKYCTFNCIYCECGWTNIKPEKSEGLPTREEVKELLRLKLKEMKTAGHTPDAITFAGNGEPSIHPDFPEIIEDTILLRDEYFPDARITVLSNASMLHRDKVFNALQAVDNNIQKLDAGSEQLFQLINQSAGKLNLEKVVEYLCQFKGNLIVQSLFVKGEYEGKPIDNTTDEEIALWLEHIKKIKPKYVMIYSFERSTPADTLDVVSNDELLKIASKVNQLGIETKVY